MSTTPKKAARAATSSPSMTIAQAFTGLHLHENVDLADGLEFFIRGYIDCAQTEKIAFVPRSCTNQALSAFAHHESWGEEEGNCPWDRLDRAWKHAAMQKLVYHVRDGQSLGVPSLLPAVHGQGQDTGSRARSSIEEEEEEAEAAEEGEQAMADSLFGDGDLSDGHTSTASFKNLEQESDDEVSDHNPFQAKGKGKAKAKGKCKGNPPTGLKHKKANSHTPQRILRRDDDFDFPWDIPSSVSPRNSPTHTAALRRASRNSDGETASAAGPSSSPLTSLAGSSTVPRNEADTTSSSRNRRHQTRAHTRRMGNAARATTASPSGVIKSRRKGRATPDMEKLWAFEAILDSRVREDDVQYRVKWTSGKPTWEPSMNLDEALQEIADFHGKHPGKPGPPGWFARGWASGEAEVEGKEKKQEQDQEEAREEIEGAGEEE